MIFKPEICGYPMHPRLNLTCGQPKPCYTHGEWSLPEGVTTTTDD